MQNGYRETCEVTHSTNRISFNNLNGSCSYKKVGSSDSQRSK